MSTIETLNQRKLRQALVDSFNESELQTLCFDLKIDYETLPPGSKLDKVRELIALCLRDNRINELISLCENARPRVAWRDMMITAVSAAEPPFMGLKYFDAAHADLFFGRETLTAELTAHLQANHFLAVVGASGSGKSSLVRAGLVPALQKAQPELRIHVFTPTDQPLEALATALTRHTDSVGVTAKLIDAMASDARSLHLAVRRLVKDDEQIVLVIDQFEELFTLCRSEEKRQAFVDNLVSAVTNPDGPPNNRPTRAVIALRADFYHHCAQYDALRRLLETQQRYIGAMSPAELRRAIELPARQHNLSFEDGLVDMLLRDVGASGDQPPEPGALPLLSHALLETWRRREANTLTFSGYTDAGGVQGAIAKTAESVFQQQLTPEQQTIARSIFLRLTELGEGTQDTRRRALISELLPTSDTAEETQAVLHLLSAARLVTTDEETAEVAHEALIREWPTLRHWLSHNREGLRLHRHLTESAHEWRELNHDPDELYRGTRLEQATEWAVKHDDELNDLERTFLAESARFEKAQKRSERLIQVLGISALLIILAGSIVATIFFNRQANENRDLAEQESNARTTAEAAQSTSAANAFVASANEATAVAAVGTARAANNEINTLIEQQATLAAELSNLSDESVAAEGIRATATAIAAAALEVDADGDGLTLAQEMTYETDPTLPDSDFDGLLDGEEIQAGTDPLDFDTDFDGIFDGEDREPLRPFISSLNPFISGETGDFQLEEVLRLTDFFLAESERLPFYGLSISADLNYIAAGSYGSGTPTFLNIWLRDGSMITPFNTLTEEPVLATGFAANRLHAIVGTTLFSYGLSERAGWQQHTIPGFGGTLCSAAFHPANSTVLVGGRAKWGYFQIINNGLLEIESDSQNYNTNACATDAIFSADGSLFGYLEDEGQDESVLVGQEINRSFGRPFNKNVSGTIDMALSPNNAILALGFENGRVNLYDYAASNNNPQPIYEAFQDGIEAHPNGFAHVIFSPDSTIFATSSPEDGTIKLWHVDNGNQLLELDTAADGVTSLIFSQDGHYLLFATTTGEVHVYAWPEVQR
ncbi:MAG: hypothetical protein IPM53_09385 [Anaerolineaceae bacterium]|nr:hypothetical protein [Anaerolineaceae bacterium]